MANPFDRFDEPVGTASGNPFDRFDNAPDVAPRRSSLAEIATGVKRGLYQGAQGAGAVLQAPAEMAHEEPGIVSRVGRSLEQFGKTGAEENAAQAETHGPVTNFLSEAGSSIGSALPLIASAVPGAAAGSAIGTALGPAGSVAGAIGGGIGSAVAGGGAAAMQAFHEKYHEALDKGLPDEQARDYASKSAALQGAGMGALSAIPAIGPLARAAGAMAEKTAATPLAELARTRFLPELGKSAAEITAGNTAIGVGTAAGQAAIDQGAGLPSPSPGEAAVSAIVPSIAGAVGFLPLGAYHALNVAKRASAVSDVLQSADANPEVRAKVASGIGEQIAQYDENAAAQWMQNAQAAIAQGKPIGLTPDWIRGPHPSVEQQRLEAPQPIIPPEPTATPDTQATAQANADAVYAARQAEEARQAGLEPALRTPPELGVPVAPGEEPPAGAEVPVSPTLGTPTRPQMTPEEEQNASLGAAFRQSENAAATQKQRELDALQAESRLPAQEYNAAVSQAMEPAVQPKTAMQLAMERAVAAREARAQQIETAGQGGPLSTIAATAVRAGVPDQIETQRGQAEQTQAVEQQRAQQEGEAQQSLTSASKVADKALADEESTAQKAATEALKPASTTEAPAEKPSTTEIETHVAALDRSIEQTQGHADALRTAGDEEGASALDRQTQRLQDGRDELAKQVPRATEGEGDAVPKPSTAEMGTYVAGDESVGRPAESDGVGRGDELQQSPAARTDETPVAGGNRATDEEVAPSAVPAEGTPQQAPETSASAVQVNAPGARPALPAEHADTVVKLRVTEAETGRQATVDMPAHEAVSMIDSHIDLATRLMQCLQS